MKLFILVFASFLTTISILAQEATQESCAKFGFRAGLALSHPNFAKGSPPSDSETTWGAGVTIGLYLNVPVSEKISIQPEYQYRQMNSEISDIKTTLNLDYLSLPIFLKYQLTKNLFILAGPQFDLLIKGESAIDGETSNITKDTEERSIGASFGIGYSFWKTLSFEIQYMQGLNHIGIGQRNDIREFKFESVQLTTSMNF